MVAGLTSLSRELLGPTVVMTPVSESMANRSVPVNREYLILTWRLPSSSLSVAFTFPTSVPAAQKHDHGAGHHPHRRPNTAGSEVCISCPAPGVESSGTLKCSGTVNIGALSFTSSTITLKGKGSSVGWPVLTSKTLVVNCEGKKDSFRLTRLKIQSAKHVIWFHLA